LRDLGPGQSAEIDGWRVRLDALGTRPGSDDCAALLLTIAPRMLANSPANLPANPPSKPDDEAIVAEQAAFSYTISHDLRAPIRVVEGFGRILKEDYGAALDRVGRDHLDG